MTLNQAEVSRVQEVIKRCGICTLYKKPPPRPAVSLPRSQDVNDVVAMDLHQLMPNLWYLHMIDEYSRYSRATIIKSKHASVIVQKFMQCWISVIGAPQKVLSDNGKEFDNAEFRDMCENFNIKVMTTPAFAPWCNGICERHNAILSDILHKVRKDTDCDWETGLAWSVSAKNSLVNHNGFSPQQIMFGRQPNLPSVMNDKLPALEGTTISEKVGSNISALYAARRAFAAADSSERIRKALRHQTRPFSGKFAIGETVYFKRAGSNEWKGPAKILGQDGVVVFLRNGAQLIRAHSSRVQRVDEDASLTNEGSAGESPSHSETRVHEPEPEKPESPITTPESPHHDSIQNNKDSIGSSSKKNITLRNNQVVQFMKNGVQYEVKILSRAGKATGKYANCFNVKYRIPVSKNDSWVNFDEIEDLTEVSPKDQECTPDNVNDNHTSNDVMMVDTDFTEAKQKEIRSWVENNVFEEEADTGQKSISLKWVCTLKQTSDGILPKARLVARGFEDPDVENIEKDSPTCCKSSLRAVIAITIMNGWRLHSLDIKTAFLQGEKLDRQVYVRPPKEAESSMGKLWKLRKCVYGLSDASLQWYGRVKRFMLESGGKMTKCDPAIFCWHDPANQLQGLIAVHVDDFLWAGNICFKETVIPKLRETFKIGNEESSNFKYLGLDIHQNNKDVYIDQNNYINSLSLIKIEQTRKDDELLSKKEQDELRSRIGQFLWISSQTRPDISYDVCILATNFKTAAVRDIRRANKVLRKLKCETSGIKFRALNPTASMKIVCYTDASFANLGNGGSQAGNLVFMMGEDGVCNLLHWESKRIKRVVKSSLAAETLALSEGIDNASFMASLVSELRTGSPTGQKIPIDVITDNLSLYNSLKSHKQVTEKRLRVDLAAIKEMLLNGQVEHVRWTESRFQLADKLTKIGASSSKLMDTLNSGQLPNF